MSVETAVYLASLAVVVLAGAGVIIGFIGAMFWVFDPRRIEERGE